ncbi:MAG: T9SS type A sorting domain-containing protein, partial [Bacteroidota bacterium]
ELALGHMSEITDPFAQPIAGASLAMPRLVSAKANADDLNVWPNPASSALNIQWPLNSDTRNWTVEMLDLSGRVVLSTSSAAMTTTLEARLSLEGLSAGSYMVRVRLENQEGQTFTTVRRVQVNP